MGVTQFDDQVKQKAAERPFDATLFVGAILENTRSRGCNIMLKQGN